MIAENRAVLAARHAQERQDLAEMQAAEVEAFESGYSATGGAPATSEQVRARQDEAIQRITAFLVRHAERNVAEKEIIFRVDYHELRASDLTMLVNAVLDARVAQVEPYSGDTRDGKLYLTQDQATLLVNLFGTYFPADFENYETGRYVKSLTGVLTSFASVKL